MGDWYKSGYKGAQEVIDQNALGSPARFFMKDGQAIDVVPANSEPSVCVNEHEFRVQRAGRNFPDREYVTCLHGVHDTTPCCEELGRGKRYFAGYFTVVNCTGWTSKAGKKGGQYEIQLMAAKSQSIEYLGKKNASKGGLANKLWTASRAGQKTATIGGEWELQREVDVSKLVGIITYNGKKLVDLYDKAEADPIFMVALKRVFTLPEGADGKIDRTKLPEFNYLSILEPKTPAQVKSLVHGAIADEGFGDDAAGAGPKGGSQANEPAPF